MDAVTNISNFGPEYSSSCGSPLSADGATPSPDNDTPPEAADSDAKRRKLRKGTHSCWECKRRKIRCTFAAVFHDACIPCRRRGTSCLSQEFSQTAETEQPSPPTAACLRRIGQLGERIVHVETLIEELSRKINLQLSENSRSIPTPASSTCCDGSGVPHVELSPASIALGGEDNDVRPEPRSQHRDPESQALLRLESSSQGKHEKLSKALHAAMPTAEDAEIVSAPGNNFFVQVYRQTLTSPYSYLSSQDPNTYAKILAKVPSPDQHPVVLARYMLAFALQLQTMNDEANGRLKALSTDRLTLMARLAETAIALVTSNDGLLDSVEGLECVLLQGLYETIGRLMRQSWVTFRRAMLVAQLMGIQRTPCPPLKIVDRNTLVDPHTLWLRVVHHDRWASFLLGLPQGSPDTSMASNARLAADTPMGRLERSHTALAARILARNEQAQLGPQDWATTEAINTELHRASKILSQEWWLLPNLSIFPHGSPELYPELLRMTNQLTHFSLINNLYLPYMLRFSADEQSYHSTTRCVQASREILNRFVVYQTFNRGARCCRSTDIYALTASVTLLLAYIDSHKVSRGMSYGTFVHQRMGDRAMMGQVLENMDRLAREDKTALSEKNAAMMRCLLFIEEEAARDGQYSTQSMLGSDTEDDLPSEKTVLSIEIPYFGIVNVAKDGVSKVDGEEGKPEWGWGTAEVPTKRPESAPPADRDEKAPPRAPPGPPPLLQSSFTPVPGPHFPEGPSSERVSEPPAAGPQLPHPTLWGPVGAQEHLYQFEPQFEPQFESQFESGISQALQQQYHYPALTGGAEDWEFRDVDATFFENLMREATEPSGMGRNDGGGPRHGPW